MRGRVIISCLLTLSTMVLHLSLPLFFKKIIDYLSPPISFPLLSWVLLGYGICWTFNQTLGQIRTFLIFQILERSIQVLSLKFIDHLFSLSLRFHMDRQTGTLMNNLQRAQNGIESVFWGLFSFLLPTCIELIVVITLIITLFGGMYGALLLTILAAHGLVSAMGIRKSVRAQKVHNDKRSYASGRMVDSLLNYETVKYFTNEKYEHDQIEAALKDQEQAGVQRYKIDVWAELSQTAILGLGLIYLTWMSGKAVHQGTMTVGNFIMINGYLLQFLTPLNYLGYVMFQVRKGFQDIESAYQVLLQKPEVQDISHPSTCVKNVADVVFNHVDFGYTAERIVLKDISFEVSAGQTVGVVGPTGSGKSTLARLLFRFYDVQNGTITMNGINIRSLSQETLHQAIGIVPQDPVLFNHTLYYNIAYGNPLASKAEVEKAAVMANLDAFIHSLPDGYQTLVGERGLKLSGGEKQRVAIARALIKNPALFIFDEATSSLDSKTELEIQKNLKEISAGITTLIIAHRLSTIQHADKIVVLDQGKIIEQGNHEQLLQKEGLYAKLWHQQVDRILSLREALT
ncbi:MAG: ABC transporter ATP-binding protein/permease [Verrucomicrobia bacterium]|nr:ABC transporter ATP-binding protein/permease [Verrucomicrobiota bacterium]